MKRFALIMIDMQRGFLDPASPLCIPSAAATVPACAAAMDACRRAGTPVVYATRHYRADEMCIRDREGRTLGEDFLGILIADGGGDDADLAVADLDGVQARCV